MQDKEAIKELEKLNFYVDEVARVTYHSNGKIKSMEGVKNFKFLGDERSKTNQDRTRQDKLAKQKRRTAYESEKRGIPQPFGKVYWLLKLWELKEKLSNRKKELKILLKNQGNFFLKHILTTLKTV